MTANPIPLSASALRELPGGETMTEINIPDDAVEAAFSGGWSDTLTRGEMKTVLANATPLILAAELDRLIADRNNYNLDGTFRPVVLVKRMSELRKAGEQS